MKPPRQKRRASPGAVPGHLKVGCCGFGGTRHSYFRQFTVGEVEDVFFHPPLIETLESWRAEAPKEFEFVVPAWQLVTHGPDTAGYHKLRMPVPADRKERFGHLQTTDEVRAAWELSLKCAEALRAKMIVLSTPAEFRHTPENEDRAVAFFRKMSRNSARVAWEPHESWPADTVESICGEHRVIAAGDPFAVRWRGDGTRYFRLHGRSGRSSRYGAEDFATLAEFCATQIPTYVMFGNLKMASDASRFIKCLQKREPVPRKRARKSR